MSDHESGTERIKHAVEKPSDYGLRQWTGWVLGPGFLLITLLAPPPEGLSPEGWRTAGLALLMAIFWICESIPIPATALLPLVLMPALHLAGIREAAAPFAHPVIFLFMGGFFIAVAMQKWKLHLRLALNIIGWLGTEPRRIVAGFLLASCLVSMWVSNSATALMMYPIGLSVLALCPRDQADHPAFKAFGTALMLAVAYGATTGGMATLIGTPPNALLAAYVNDTYHLHLGFGQWMLLGVPVTLVTLPGVYIVLTRVSFRLPQGYLPGMKELLAVEKSRLGPVSGGEKWVLIVFTLTALGWVFQPLLAKVIPMLSDTVIAMAGALALFLIPVRPRQGIFALDWQTAKNIPWDVLLLFGGGLSLAAAIEKHGLAIYLGQLCQGLDGVPVILVMAILCFGILMLTELTSNTATAATFLPVAGSIALALGQNPLYFLIPCALAANCSFMLPVGTPPNAIVYGSGKITLPQMAKAGMWLNLLMIPIILGLLILLGPWIFDLQFDTLPEWIKEPLPAVK